MLQTFPVPVGLLWEEGRETRSLRSVISEARSIRWHYELVREIRPRLIVETGVRHGRSSAAWLGALFLQGRGELHSVDLPYSAPWSDADGRMEQAFVVDDRDTGRLVPGRLRSRWHLHLGDARELLPRLLDELGPVDLFYHDSEHSREHMLFEYRTAWPHLSAHGALASDDVGRNDAFATFAHEVRREPQYVLGGRRGVIRVDQRPSE